MANTYCRLVMDDYIKAAIEEAKKGLLEGGIPIGSILVKDGKIAGEDITGAFRIMIR